LLNILRIPPAYAVLLCIAFLLPSALFSWMAWQHRQHELQKAEETARRTVWAIREHAVKVFDFSLLLLHELDRELAGLDWETIAGDERLYRHLREHAAASSHIASINLADSTGSVRASSLQFPAPAGSVDERDYFIAHREGRLGPYIGKSMTGPLTGERLFVISIPRRSRGGFDGILSVAVPVEYFTAFWQQFAPTLAHVIPMVREDGELLARYPAQNNPERLAPNAPFVQQFTRSPHGFYTAVSQVDGTERLNAYTKVGPYPVFVSFSIEKNAVLAAWRSELARYGVFALMATLALVTLTLAILRHATREHAAANRWRAAAKELEEEMARRQAAEKQLHKAQKMEALGQLTGGVAHDFNNILQLISANVRLAMTCKLDQDEARAALAKAVSAVDRGSKLTAQLLSLSRRQPLAARPVDMASLARSVAVLLRATLGAVHVEVEASHETWPAMVDETQAEMALLNLAVNARDAMPQGGTLHIRTGNVRIGAAESGRLGLRQGDYVLLSVSDEGVGMPAEVIERALEPFFTTKEIGRGTGLGLSQVHSFAVQSGGGIALESEPAKGTTVRLYLPRAHDARHAILAPTSPRP
jgi:two-component system, NtrC family, sensor kinase